MALSRLRVDGETIVSEEDDEGGAHRPVHLRGVSIGGFLHLENFINGYPGTGHELHQQFAAIAGAARAEFFFGRMLDHFFTEADVQFIRETGATAIRLPLNYRHFERDDRPFESLEQGFARVDQVVDWCRRHGLYVILDGHAAPGWQNTDWSSDNGSCRALFWQHRQFQDRFVAWWERLADRYRDEDAVAGYDLMNEPVANAPPGGGFDKAAYEPDWDAINALYRRTVKAIRAIDPAHIIFLEGEGYSERFVGLDAPFAENLVYSSHQYSVPGFGPGSYPGTIQGEHWDLDRQRAAYAATEGARFTRQHRVPHWVGEFGAVYNGPSDEVKNRLHALDDQLALLNKEAAHWTLWTYKDCGVVGWMTLDPDCDYLQRTRHVRQAKIELDTDFWLHWLPASPQRRLRQELAQGMLAAVKALPGQAPDPEAHQIHLSLAVTSCAGALLQPAYVEIFRTMSEREIDDCLASFALANCRPNAGLLEVVRKRMTAARQSG